MLQDNDLVDANESNATVHSPNDGKPHRKRLSMANGLAIGIAIGAASGVATGNIAVGIGFGIGIGLAIWLAMGERSRRV